VRPTNFKTNIQTSLDNVYQKDSEKESNQNVQQTALKEFNLFTEKLISLVKKIFF
jgi:hypothetical protein